MAHLPYDNYEEPDPRHVRACRAVSGCIRYIAYDINPGYMLAFAGFLGLMALAVEDRSVSSTLATANSTITSALAAIALPSAILRIRPDATPVFPGEHFEVLLANSGLNLTYVVNAHVRDSSACLMALNTSDASYDRLIQAGYDVNRGVPGLWSECSFPHRLWGATCHPVFNLIWQRETNRVKLMLTHGLDISMSCLVYGNVCGAMRKYANPSFPGRDSFTDLARFWCL